MRVWNNWYNTDALVGSHTKRLEPYGFKAFSQGDEDGIIQEIFRRIGVSNRRFIEIGVGNGLECNTLNLLYNGWSGLWIEGSQEFCSAITKGLPKTLESARLRLAWSFITKENVNAIISQNNDESEIDLLSIDVDGNDFHVLQAIDCVCPRVIVMEYNAKFFPPVKYCMQYDATYVWDRSDRHGASLSFLETALFDMGYRLVGCSYTGANAFFVKSDEVKDHFEAPFTTVNHFNPARYELIGVPHGHPASYLTLENAILMF